MNGAMNQTRRKLRVSMVTYGRTVIFTLAGFGDDGDGARAALRQLEAFDDLIKAAKEARQFVASSDAYNSGGGFANRLMNVLDESLAKAEGIQ